MAASATPRLGQQISVQTYARAAGALAVLSFIAGGFGESYVPSKIIISGDAVATLQNIRSFESLFRLGFAAYLVEAACDLTLALLFYALLKPVNRYMSLLAAFFGILSTATFAVAELFYFAPSLLAGRSESLNAFSPDQLSALALLSFKVFAVGAWIFTIFYGVAWIVRGFLMFRSGYFPKFIGVLMMIAGLVFVTRNLAVVLAPTYPSAWIMALIVPGFLAMTAWLLVKGVDVAKWNERIAAAAM